MAIPSTNVWEIQTGGSDTLNGGGFDPANASMATDLTVTSGGDARTTTPVVKSASYNFVAGDVGNWLYIKSGTNWYPGWYKITAVASNEATLSASIGAATLNTPNQPNFPGALSTAAGIASVQTPTSGTWAIDYSQQAGVQFSLTGLTTAAANAIILTASATKAMVGNGLVITGGTNFTTGFYSISSVSAGVSLTVDRTCTSAAGAAGTAGLGGALATPAQGATNFVAGNVYCLKNGTFSVAAGISFAGAVTLIGYTTVRGDIVTKTILQASTTGFTLLSTSVSAPTLYNLELDGNSQGTTTGFACATGNPSLFNCRIRRFVTGLNPGGILTSTLVRCEVDNNTTAGFAAVNTAYVLRWCYIHDNGANFNSTGSSTNVTAYNTVLSKNAGIGYPGRVSAWYNCVFYKCVSDAISPAANTNALTDLVNCVFWGNGGYAVNNSGAQLSTLHRAFNVASGGNISGDFSAINYKPDSFVPLTVDPFVDGDNGNFSLNTTAGGGAACRAAGFPGVFPGGTTTGYLDIGAVQHQDSGGSSPANPLSLILPPTSTY